MSKELAPLIEDARKELDLIKQCVSLAIEKIDNLNGNEPSDQNVLCINTILGQLRLEAGKLADIEKELLHRKFS